MQNHLSFPTVAFPVAAGLLVLSCTAAAYSTIRHNTAQRNVSHTWRDSTVTGTYPSVSSHSILDHSGTPRIVMLHKLTKPLPPSVPNAFHWVDLIAIDPGDHRLECKIAGKSVPVDPDALAVFYAIDDSLPARLTVAGGAVATFATPESAWEKLVGSVALEVR